MTPTYKEQDRLDIKIRHLRRMREEVESQKEELLEMLTTTADPLDRQAIREEVREMGKILANQRYALRGL